MISIIRWDMLDMTDFSFLPVEKRLNDSSLQQVICIGFAVIFQKTSCNRWSTGGIPKIVIHHSNTKSEISFLSSPLLPFLYSFHSSSLKDVIWIKPRQIRKGSRHYVHTFKAPKLNIYSSTFVLLYTQTLTKRPPPPVYKFLTKKC